MASSTFPVRNDHAAINGTCKIIAGGAEATYVMKGLNGAADSTKSAFRIPVVENDNNNFSISIRSSTTIWGGSIRQHGDLKGDGISVRKVPLRYQDSHSYKSLPPLAPVSALNLDATIQFENKADKSYSKNILDKSIVDKNSIEKKLFDIYSTKRLKHFKTLDLDDDDGEENIPCGSYENVLAKTSSCSVLRSNNSSCNELQTYFIGSEERKAVENEQKQHSIYYYQSPNTNILYAARLKVLIVDDVASNRYPYAYIFLLMI